MANMSYFFDHVEVSLVTGGISAEVNARSERDVSATLHVRNSNILMIVTEEQVRDILAAMKQARKAAKVVNNEVPFVSRQED